MEKVAPFQIEKDRYEVTISEKRQGCNLTP